MAPSPSSGSPISVTWTAATFFWQFWQIMKAVLGERAGL